MTNFKTTNLICGCCVAFFKTWPGYRDTGNDAGYGTCKSCIKWSNALAFKTIDDAADKITKSLSPKNRDRFLGYSVNKKRLIVMRLIDAGALKYTVNH